MDPRLETPRLALRPLGLGEVGALRSLLIHPDVRRWKCDGQVLSEAAVRSAVMESLAAFRSRGTGLFGVRLGTAAALAGYAGMKPASIGGLELVAAVWPRHWRQGLAAEACRAVLDDAFGRAGLARALACADAPNVRSPALIARLGFRPFRNTPGAFGAIRWFALEREAARPDAAGITAAGGRPLVRSTAWPRWNADAVSRVTQAA